MEKELELVIDKLAEKLGTSVEFLWSVLIKQAYVYVTYSAFGFLIILLAGFIIYKIHKKLHRNNSYKEEDGEFYMTIIFVSFLAWIFTMGFFLVFNISEVVTALLNPEYWAINKIISKL